MCSRRTVRKERKLNLLHGVTMMGGYEGGVTYFGGHDEGL
jgi:hypothetical protein